MRARWLAAAPLLLPLALWLAVLPDFGRLQYHDYYDVVRQVTEGARVSRDPADWLSVHSNEHWVPIPVVVYALNWSVTHGDNRALSLMNLLTLAAIALLVVPLLPQELLRDPRRRSVAVVASSLLVLAPTAAHQVILGFSGTMWLLADLLAVAAILAVTAGPSRGHPSRVVLGATLGLIGYAVYSTNLALWPALVGAALALRLPRRQLAVLVGAGALVITSFALTYETPGHHPGLETRHPVTLVLYVLRLLGSPLVGPGPHAAAVGLVLAAAAALPLVTLGRAPDRCRALIPWWALEAYVVGNATMAAVARSGFGLGQAGEVRYLPLATLFLVGALGGLATMVPAGPRGTAARAAVALLALGLAAAATARGMPLLRLLLENARQQPAAEFALRHGVIDESVIRGFLPWPTTLPPVIPFLQAIDHVPFDRPRDPEIDAPVRPDPAVPGCGVEIVDVVPVQPGVVRIRGCVEPCAGRFVELLLVDLEGVVRGKAFSAFEVCAPNAGGPAGEGILGWARSDAGALRLAVRHEPATSPIWIDGAQVSP